MSKNTIKRQEELDRNGKDRKDKDRKDNQERQDRKDRQEGQTGRTNRKDKTGRTYRKYTTTETRQVGLDSWDKIARTRTRIYGQEIQAKKTWTRQTGKRA